MIGCVETIWVGGMPELYDIPIGCYAHQKNGEGHWVIINPQRKIDYPEGKMNRFTPVNIFDFEPRFPYFTSAEPPLRQIIFQHYMTGLEGLNASDAAHKAKCDADEYIAQILEAYFGISRSD
jgi:hypothetical protein